MGTLRLTKSGMASFAFKYFQGKLWILECALSNHGQGQQSKVLVYKIEMNFFGL